MTVSAAPNLKIDCSHCPIRHRAVCSRCTDEELQQLNEIKFYKSVPAGKTIALRGEKLDVVASIVSGVATLSDSTADGRAQTVGLLLPSDFIGRPGRDSVGHDITAITDLTLCCFRRKPFDELMVETPHVRERLLEMLVDELDAARDWMLLLGRMTAREKIASFLMLIVRRSSLADKDGHLGEAEIDLPLSREEMASYLGLTIETVSRQLTSLRKEGVISLLGTRRVLIPDMGALASILGDEI